MHKIIVSMRCDYWLPETECDRQTDRQMADKSRLVVEWVSYNWQIGACCSSADVARLSTLFADSQYLLSVDTSRRMYLSMCVCVCVCVCGLNYFHLL